MALFESRTPLSCSPETAFDFISRPVNLQKIAPPEMGLVFVNAPEVVELGCRLTVKVQAYGQIQQLDYEIIEFESPVRFREKGIGGPMKLWLHDYIVEPTESGVLLVNRIEFEPPGGLVGLLITKDRILDHLEDGFEFRRQALQKELG